MATQEQLEFTNTLHKTAKQSASEGTAVTKRNSNTNFCTDICAKCNIITTDYVTGTTSRPPMMCKSILLMRS